MHSTGQVGTTGRLASWVARFGSGPVLGRGRVWEGSNRNLLLLRSESERDHCWMTLPDPWLE